MVKPALDVILYVGSVHQYINTKTKPLYLDGSLQKTH